jgi:hypothetical protein
MLVTIGWVTVGLLFAAAGALLFEVAMLIKQARENDQVICEWLAEIEANNEKADALLR